jgi:spermidine synthase
MLHSCCLARTPSPPIPLPHPLPSLHARGRPAETLFQPAFYQGLKDAMRPGAIMCNQGECIWLHLDLIGTVLRHCTAARSK